MDPAGEQPKYQRRPVVYDDDGFPVVPKYRQRAWEGLSWSEHRAVLRAARRGESHPDPAIAKAARDWAQAVLAPRTPSRGFRDALSRLLEDPSGGTLGQLFAERRAARRILNMRSTREPEQPGTRRSAGSPREPPVWSRHLGTSGNPGFRGGTPAR